MVPRNHALHYYAILSDCYLNESQKVLVDIFSLKPAGWQPDSQQKEMAKSELTGMDDLSPCLSGGSVVPTAQEWLGFWGDLSGSSNWTWQSVNFPGLFLGRAQPLHEMCPLLERGREKEATSVMTQRREMKIVFRLENNPFESHTFASRIYIYGFFLFPSH